MKRYGIECDLSEVEKALEEIANAKAVKMRNRALESLGKIQKRQPNEEEENAKPQQKSRRSGSDTFA